MIGLTSTLALNESAIGLSRSQFVRRCKRGFQKRQPVPSLEWLPRHVRFPQTWESSDFDFRKMPHVRGFIERFWLDPRKRKANLPWSVRSGKTTTLLAIMCWVADQDPAPMGILFPNQKMLDQAVSEHIWPMLERTRPIAKQLLPGYRRNNKSIVLRDCRVRLANAGTVSDSSGWPAKYIFKFEHDKCPTTEKREADASRRIESRTAGYARGVKIVEEGSPQDASTSRAARLLASKSVQQVRYHVPCPHCHEYQQLDFFKQLRIPPEAVKNCDAMLAMREARYHCCKCNEVIEDHQRTAMMQAGVWLIEGEWLDAQGNICGAPTVDSDTMVFGGYNILYSLFIESWGVIAREWIEAKEAQRQGDLGALKRFFTEMLAQPWDDKPKTVANDKLAEHLRGSHSKGFLPAETAFITTTADVGIVDMSGGNVSPDNLIFQWQTMAWWQGFQGAVIDWGVTVGVQDFLKWVNETSFSMQGRPEVRLPVSEFPIALDSGTFSTEVCAVADMIDRAYAIKGDSKTGDGVSVDLFYPGNRRAGLPSSVVSMKRKLGIYDLTMINTDKTQNHRLAIVSMRMHPGHHGFVYLPFDVCDGVHDYEAFFEQLKADYRDGRKWERSGPNEAGDNLRYGLAAAQKETRNGLLWNSITLNRKYLNLPDPAPRVPVHHRKRNRQFGGQPYLISNRGQR